MTTDTTQTPSPVTPMPPVPTTTSRQRGGGWLNIVLVVALALAVGGVAFSIGRSTAPASTLTGMRPGMVVGPQGSFAPGAGGANGAGPGAVLGAGGLTIDGVVTSVDAGTMTITLDSGDTVTVTLDDTTTYHSAVEASSEDVAVGDDVAVRVAGGGRFGLGPNASAAPSLTASDVTVVQ
jgi:hypothetical protein